ncbi:inactive pancreatic lipase-related protein 1-like [Discoglossus pictus]
MFVFWAVWILFLGVLKGEEDCYEYPKCFPNDGPWSNLKRHCPMPEPQSPEKINTTFHLYTRQNNYTPQVISARNLSSISSSNFNSSKKIFFFIHGYFSNGYKPWNKEVCLRILQVRDCNCIIVDWGEGANEIYYPQAASNVRIVGANLALCLQFLQREYKCNASDFYLIGESLGGHVAGEAGRRIKGIGTIIGLDPVAACFKCTDPVVSLDRSDANRVIVIHTSSGDCSQKPSYCKYFTNLLPVDMGNILNFGICQPLGHIDLYPNSGENMPGCPWDTGLPNMTVFSNPFTVPFCNHQRSLAYFLNSITNPGIYVGYPCSDYHNFKAGNCQSCPSAGCPTMGFYSDNYTGITNGSQIFYLSIPYPENLSAN